MNLANCRRSYSIYPAAALKYENCHASVLPAASCNRRYFEGTKSNNHKTSTATLNVTKCFLPRKMCSQSMNNVRHALKPFSFSSQWRNKQRKFRKETGPQALFTGIVEELGQVKQLHEVDGGWELIVEASAVLQDVKLGDSIAVNGTCLTVTRFDPTYFAVGLAPETLRKTSLGEVLPGSPVNLERSLRPDSRMGGHFVQGHVDGTGVIKEFRPEGDSLWVTVKAPPELLHYVVPKGYIAIDGTSLTVVDVIDEVSCFTFMLVAYTQSKVVIPMKKVGDKVNLEVDIVGKYVERMMPGYRLAAYQPATVEASKVGDWGSLQ